MLGDQLSSNPKILATIGEISLRLLGNTGIGETLSP
jgi:hypothetical protein